MGRKIVIHSTEQVNDATGEVLTTSKTVNIHTRSSDEFFMVFIKFIGGFYELKSAVDMKVLIVLCEMVDFNTGNVLLPAGTRKEILTKLKIQTSHLSNSLKRLKDAHLITGEQGCYQLNPIVAWKGDIKTRDELIKAKGLEFKINFNSKEFE